MGHLKIPFAEIKQALLAMDEKKFSESHLKQLLLYAPDKEEVRIIVNQLNSQFIHAFQIIHYVMHSICGILEPSVDLPLFSKLYFPIPLLPPSVRLHTYMYDHILAESKRSKV